MASISMCSVLPVGDTHLKSWNGLMYTRQEEGMRTWQEVAASHCHRSAGRQKRRTTAGSHTNGCMVEYSEAFCKSSTDCRFKADLKLSCAALD